MNCCEDPRTYACTSIQILNFVSARIQNFECSFSPRIQNFECSFYETQNRLSFLSLFFFCGFSVLPSPLLLLRARVVQYIQAAKQAQALPKSELVPREEMEKQTQTLAL